MLKKLQISNDDLRKLKKIFQIIKINFLCTAFDLEGLKFLKKGLKLKNIKISSTDLDNYPMLFYAGKSFKKIFLSTGLSNIKKVDLALKVLFFHKNAKHLKNARSIKKNKKVNFSILRIRL